MTQRKAETYPNLVPCHLCGYPIPDYVVNPHHPLFGTIDHLKPRALGGKDASANRAPAHRFCNGARGVAEVTPELREAIRLRALQVWLAKGLTLVDWNSRNKRWKPLRQDLRKAVVSES